MTRSAVVHGSEKEENKILHRYTTERMADSYEIPPREVHRRVVRWATEQKLHYAFGKKFGSGCKKDAVMDIIIGVGDKGISSYPHIRPTAHR